MSMDYSQLKMTASTASTYEECEHKDGWYVHPRFWWFTRKYLCCTKCGKLIPQGKWEMK